MFLSIDITNTTRTITQQFRRTIRTNNKYVKNKRKTVLKKTSNWLKNYNKHYKSHLPPNTCLVISVIDLY